MLGFRFIRATPATWIMQMRDGAVVREGAGLAFWYYAPRATIVAVPLTSVDAPFMLKETSADWQDVTVQGQVSYRIADPQAAAQRLQFALRPDGAGYVSDDPEKLPGRVTAAAQVEVRALVGALTLEAALGGGNALGASLRERLRASPVLAALGVEVLDVAVLAVKAAPETARALEAAAREAILRRADDALYERRNGAIEQERRVQENQLATELAVQTRRQEMRETALAAEAREQDQRQAMRADALEADVLHEARNRDLVAMQAENTKVEADAALAGTRALLATISTLDPRIVQALMLRGAKSDTVFAQAFAALADNAAKIGELNLGPELLGNFVRKHA